MSESGETSQPTQEQPKSSSETQRLTRRMRFKANDGSEYRIGLPSKVNNEAVQNALTRVGAVNEGDIKLNQTPFSRAVNAFYGAREAIGAKIKPLQPREIPRDFEGKIEK